MIRLVIGVSETFDSAHFIPNHERCGKVHGHTYKVEVEVEGELKDGMIVDFADLKAILGDIVAKYDHRLINELIENPTCENLCIAIYEEIEDRLKDSGLKVVRVKVYENPDKWAEIRL
jgi:6-pyruvoyltetrahydropterin/6-carboxytetrahydropterin synthase